LIHNPTAGDERPTALDLQQMLSESGFQVRYQSTKKDWKKALQWKADLIVAAGGDGTVAKVFRTMAGRDTPLAVFPIGTANNVARTLRIVGDAHEVIASWRTLTPRRFDLGTIRTGDRERIFVEAAGGGLFADSMEQGKRVQTADGLTGNEIDRALAHLRSVLVAARVSEWRVLVDGRDASGEYLAVETMNIRHAGPSVPIAPKADPHDGWLDVVLIAESDRAELLEYVEQRLAQHEVPLPKLTVERGRRIELDGDSATMRVDDQIADSGKAWTIDVQPGAVNVFSPVAS
jgi:diacylglycerol kinase family enzyme